MTEAVTRISKRVAALQREFDRSFAAAPAAADSSMHDLLAIRIGSQHYALRLTEIAGLFVDKKITRVPGGDPALLGLAGFRGALIPVYGLRILFGDSGAAPSRWLVVAATAPVALAFELFESHFRAAADAILPQQSPAQTRRYAPELIRKDDIVRPLLHLPALIAGLGATGQRHATPLKE